MPGYRLARAAACFTPSRTSIHRFTIDRYVKVYRDDVRDAVQRNDGQAPAR